MAATKLKFKTAYDTRTDEMPSTPVGEKIVYEHREVMHDNGKRELVKDRAINIYEKIQASKEQCEIENILRRAAEGDLSVLNAVQGNYLDITDAPSSLAEAQKFVIRAKAEFDELPRDIRAKFENNAEQYVAEYGTNAWADKTGLTARWEEEKKVAESRAKYEELQKKAFENLAEKGSINNE